MSHTILYAVFKTPKKIGRLTHLGYVAAINPHEALEKYLAEQDSQKPNALVAIPISGNKFTCYYKRKTESGKQVWKHPLLTRFYNRIERWDLKIPLNHKSWMEQLHIKYNRLPNDGSPTIQTYK